MSDNLRLQCFELALKHGNRVGVKITANQYIEWVGGDLMRLDCLRVISKRVSDTSTPSGVLYQAADMLNFVLNKIPAKVAPKAEEQRAIPFSETTNPKSVIPVQTEKRRKGRRKQ